jgi:hypothetical protein
VSSLATYSGGFHSIYLYTHFCGRVDLVRDNEQPHCM